jgi:hypothetical protein
VRILPQGARQPGVPKVPLPPRPGYTQLWAGPAGGRVDKFLPQSHPKQQLPGTGRVARPCRDLEGVQAMGCRHGWWQRLCSSSMTSAACVPLAMMCPRPTQPQESEGTAAHTGRKTSLCLGCPRLPQALSRGSGLPQIQLFPLIRH